MEESRAIPIALSQARQTLSEDEGPADLWVVPATGGDWAISREGTDEPLETFDVKDEAVDEAVRIAQQDEVVVTVQRQDGTIADRQSFRSRL